MAHATEISLRVARAAQAPRQDRALRPSTAPPPLVVVEMPVSVRYTDETLEKGQRSLGAVVILRDLLAHYLFGEQK
jgi:hypothetical protein